MVIVVCGEVFVLCISCVMWIVFFVLFDDVCVDGVFVWLYCDFVCIVCVDMVVEVCFVLEVLCLVCVEGFYVVGYLIYEVGVVFVLCVVGGVGEGVLLWFGLFVGYEMIFVVEVLIYLFDLVGVWIGLFIFEIGCDVYDLSLVCVLEFIVVGDIY